MPKEIEQPRNPQAGQIGEPIVALGIQIEIVTPGVHFDDFLLETDEIDDGDKLEVSQ